MLFADDLLIFCKAKVSVLVLIKNLLAEFASSSGLVVNESKCSLYLAGVSSQEEEQICSTMNIPKGTLPVTYLGVPLSHKKLSFKECAPLVDRITSRIKSWTSRYLSYGGRVVLIKSVLNSISSYWAQLFIFPKNLIKKVEAVCRSYLWTGTDTTSSKSPVAWAQVCLPKIFGGLNLRDLTTWNCAAVLKQLWSLCQHKERLWIKWVNEYYMHNTSPLQCSVPNGCSWFLKKILKQRELIDSESGWSQFIKCGKFSVQRTYRVLLGSHHKVSWRKLVCNNRAAPKAIFLVWMAVQERLSTCDRLSRRGIECTNICQLCNLSQESHEHLFLQCAWTHRLRELVMVGFNEDKVAPTFIEEIARVNRICGKKSSAAKAYVVVWTEMVYEVWQSRCVKVFQAQIKSPEQAARLVLFRSSVSCNEEMRDFIIR